MPSAYCLLTTVTSCTGDGGTYKGDESTCDPDPCPPGTFGACCFTSGLCAVMQPSDCQFGIGTYQGNGSDCDPTPCSQPATTGACCLPNSGGCRVTSEAGCNTSQGFYVGNGSDCDPNPCVLPDDILGIWEVTTEIEYCGTDSTWLSFTSTDTTCSVSDPYEGGSDPSTSCNYEYDDGQIVGTCSNVSTIGGCTYTTVSSYRFSFSANSYNGVAFTRVIVSGENCSGNSCYEVTINATKTGPAPDPCNAGFLLDQLHAVNRRAILERPPR